MRGPCTLTREPDGVKVVWIEKHGDRSQPHEAPIPFRQFICTASIRVAGALKASEGSTRDRADVHALPVHATHVAFVQPPAIPLHLVFGSKFLTLDKATGKTQCLAGVVRP